MQNSPYPANEIESKVQDFWNKTFAFKAKETLDQPVFYCLSMLPYPSGSLHMGHVRNYTLGDVIARYKTMQGYHVLHPLGWDAFGLPAENAAIKNQVCPQDWTLNNINQMQHQLKRMGLSVDWSREIKTCESDYYRWNQWLFLQLYEKGLAYQRESTVNWDPVDQTVLANEQVINGKGWRSGANVEQKKIQQWFFKISAYADELLVCLDKLTGWPAEVTQMQRNWIGRKHGVDVCFELKNGIDQPLMPFTTRIDTIFGVSFLGIALDHPLALKASETNTEIQTFIKKCQANQPHCEQSLAKQEKIGIETPYLAIHPLTGESIPIWICNYVLSNYGAGCVMAVPAHDERDFDFAKKYHLSIQPVIAVPEHDYTLAPYTEAQGTLMNSANYNGLTISDAQTAITNFLSNSAKGGATTTYRLRDWGISRQRYWGTPIPMIYCEQCGVVPVPESQLPVTLPSVDHLSAHGNPLSNIESFIKTTCPKCQSTNARRETDTMDTFVDSSWYFLRYTCPDQQHAMLDDRAKFWAPVDQYIGGIEHATMHLLYARFIHKVLRDLGLVNSDEPFKNLLTQGMVLKDGQKMSKSKGNVVTPMPLIEKYGADTLRLYSMFTAPPEQSLEWCDTGVEGTYRFLNKLWQLSQHWQTVLSEMNATLPPIDESHFETRMQLHQLLKQALFDIDRQQFNTVVSAAMKMLNLLQTLSTEVKTHAPIAYEGISILLRILAPITPHICYVVWQNLGFGDNIATCSLPHVDPNALLEKQLKLIVQVNGKLRGHILVDADASKEEILLLAKNCDNVQKHISEKIIKKSILVPKKLVNFVV